MVASRTIISPFVVVTEGKSNHPIPTDSPESAIKICPSDPTPILTGIVPLRPIISPAVVNKVSSILASNSVCKFTVSAIASKVLTNVFEALVFIGKFALRFAADNEDPQIATLQFVTSTPPVPSIPPPPFKNLLKLMIIYNN